MGKYVTTFEDQGAIYLAPADCGSQVSYRFTVQKFLYGKPDDKGRLGYTSTEGAVDLTDCNRKISWSIGTNDDDIKKLDRAIAQLRAARVAAVRFRKATVQLRKELKYPSTDEDD